MHNMIRTGGGRTWWRWPNHLWLVAGVAAAAAVTATVAAGASSLPDARLAGRWQLDAQASDNFDVELQRFLTVRHQAEQRDFERMRRRYPPLQAGGIPSLAEDLPPEPLETQRDRLVDSLRPPQRLEIALLGEEVQLTADDLPPSKLALDDKIIRVDGSGSAEIRLHAQAGGLALSYRYLGNARRSQQFTLGPKGDTLRVTQSWQERDKFKLTLNSVYRRQGL